MFRKALFSLVALLAGVPAAFAGTIDFDFETSDWLTNPIVSIDNKNFVTTQSLVFDAGATGHGSGALAFTDPREAFEAATYDLPAGIQTGSVSLWFKEDLTVSTSAPTFWGLSFLIEDADNPKDWGALEVSNFAILPFVPAAYFATEGAVDRRTPFDRYDSTLTRTPNVWHNLVFEISTTRTLIKVDGVAATDVAAPGTEVSPGVPRTLRLRVLGNSPSLGGNKNYRSADNSTTTTVSGFLSAPKRVWFDDLQAQAVTPVTTSTAVAFEITGGVPDFDDATTKTNVAALKGFVNKFEVTTATAHAGLRSAQFNPGDHRHRSVAFDLAAAQATTGTLTLWFYDKLGNDQGQDWFGGSVLLESGINPAHFIGVEVWNFNFPGTSDPTPGPKNYYVTQGTAGTGPGSYQPNGGTFNSRYFGDRSIGWHRIDIHLEWARSRIVVDGLENTQGTTLRYGPGLSTNPKLRIIGDSATVGGFSNYVGLDELYTLYQDSASNGQNYLAFDDLSIPSLVPVELSDFSLE